jgi:hypothetical protein
MKKIEIFICRKIYFRLITQKAVDKAYEDKDWAVTSKEI